MARTKMISATFTTEEYAAIEKAANQTDRNIAGGKPRGRFLWLIARTITSYDFNTMLLLIPVSRATCLVDKPSSFKAFKHLSLLSLSSF